MRKIKISSIEDMKSFGENLGANLKGGEVLLLKGDLGAGKTHLSQFIGRGMGIDDYINSPTFTLLNIYEGDLDLYHFDMYRLDDGVDIDELGFDEYIYSDRGVSIVEWPDRVQGLYPKDSIEIEIKVLSEEGRILNIKALEKYNYLWEDLV